MELLKVQHELFWASKSNRGFDKLFYRPGFIDKFTEFLHTDIGQRWQNSEEGKRYYEWQAS